MKTLAHIFTFSFFIFAADSACPAERDSLLKSLLIEGSSVALCEVDDISRGHFRIIHLYCGDKKVIYKQVQGALSPQICSDGQTFILCVQPANDPRFHAGGVRERKLWIYDGVFKMRQNGKELKMVEFTADDLKKYVEKFQKEES